MVWHFGGEPESANSYDIRIISSADDAAKRTQAQCDVPSAPSGDISPTGNTGTAAFMFTQTVSASVLSLQPATDGTTDVKRLHPRLHSGKNRRFD